VKIRILKVEVFFWGLLKVQDLIFIVFKVIPILTSQTRPFLATHPLKRKWTGPARLGEAGWELPRGGAEGWAGHGRQEVWVVLGSHLFQAAGEARVRLHEGGRNLASTVSS